LEHYGTHCDTLARFGTLRGAAGRRGALRFLPESSGYRRNFRAFGSWWLSPYSYFLPLRSEPLPAAAALSYIKGSRSACCIRPVSASKSGHIGALIRRQPLYPTELQGLKK